MTSGRKTLSRLEETQRRHYLSESVRIKQAADALARRALKPE
jgi:hypothetical protein